MKIIFLLFFVTIIPLSTPHSEALNTINYSHSQTIPPVKKEKHALKKKTKKLKTRQQKRRSKDIKKTKNKAPGFGIMLIGGIALLCLGIFLIGSAFFLTNGLAGAFSILFGLIIGTASLIVITIAAIFLAKGLRENKSFYQLHGKTEKELKKELAISTPQKLSHLSNSELRAYNGYQVKVHKLEAIIALKEKRKPPYTKRIRRLKKDIMYYQKRIEHLEKKNSGQENHQLNQ